MKTKLAGRRSPRWALMERFVIPDYSHPDADRNYLVRYRLLQTPLFGIFLHKIETPDPRPTLHDHPWPFTAIVLKGGYDEFTGQLPNMPHSMEIGTVSHFNLGSKVSEIPLVGETKVYEFAPVVGASASWGVPLDVPGIYARERTVRRVNVKSLRRGDMHWISRLHRIPTWTLVFVGRRRRQWGYLDRDGTWTDFLTHPHNKEFMAVMAKREGKEAEV